MQDADTVPAAHTRHCFVHDWSHLNIKNTLARLRLNQDAERGATWEVPDDIDDEYLARRWKASSG